MTLALDHPAAGDSPLARLDPRWKLAALLPAAALFAALRTLPPAMTALVGTFGLVLASRLSLQWYFLRLAVLAPFLLLLVILLPFVLEGPGPRWDLGPLHLSLHGVMVALTLGCKALSIVSLVLVLFTTAPPGVMLKAARALRLPGLLVQLLLLTYRYTFLVAEELGRVRIALRVRGYRNRANVHSYRTIGQVTGTLLVRSHERAERVAQAMRCRGFDGQFRALADFTTRWSDVAAFVGIVSFAGILLIWDRIGR